MAFITGSHAYGTPNDDSDVDLVIRVHDWNEYVLLRDMSENGKSPIRFGRLNLVVCHTEEEYAMWRVGTTRMAEDRATGFPRDQKKATKILDGLRARMGLDIKDDDSGDDN